MKPSPALALGHAVCFDASLGRSREMMMRPVYLLDLQRNEFGKLHVPSSLSRHSSYVRAVHDPRNIPGR